MATTPAPQYPGGLDTPATLLTAMNNVVLRLRGPVLAADVNLPVEPSALLSTMQAANGVLAIDDEIIVYGSIQDPSGATPVLLDCNRGADGTAAAQHASGARVELRWVAAHHNVVAAACVAIETALGVNPQGPYTNLVQRLDRRLPSVVQVAPATTDWSFTHDKRRIVGVQLWRENGSGDFELFGAPVEQKLNASGTAAVTITLPSAEAGYVVVL